MNKIRKSAGNGAMLYGANLPKNCIYGRVNYTYICKDFHGFDGGFHILRYNPNTGHWFNTISDADLTAIIAHYVKTAEPADLRIEQVTHKVRSKNKAFHAQKKADAKKRREALREEREFHEFCEQEVPFRRPPVPNQRAWSQACVDGKTLGEYQYANTKPCAYYGKGEDVDVMNNPALFRRDRIKHPFNKYRTVDDNSIKNYTGHAELKERENGHYVKVYNGGYTTYLQEHPECM